ncbi:MAG: aminotransferase class V-fold PLP-dependent enzyme [Fimbriimonadaceae bacterium]|nr:aminotransferase class V-fold PLP-dependent enzyme [Fimbriimonadaceae bacterium]
MTVESQVAKLGAGPLTEAGLREHIWPLFSRVMARDEIYLANHSLGRPLDRMTEDVREATDAWYAQMDDAWEPWLAEIERFRSSVARLAGVSDPKRIVPKTSAGQGLRAVLNALIGSRPIRVVATRGEFDSIDFILKVYRQRGFVEVDWVEPRPSPEGLELFDSRDVLAEVVPGVELVIVSHVCFNTGQILGGIEELVARCRECGAKLLVDAYHAAGVIPVEFDALGADFMIGGSYKYTRGGPGACWLAIHERHRELRTLDTGWFAKKEPFAYHRTEVPEFLDSWLESTPPVLPFYQARSGLELTLPIGIARLRTYNLDQQATLREAFRRAGVPCFEPNDPTGFGAFAIVLQEDARGFCRALKARGVNTDSRGRAVRFGPDVLNSGEELVRAAEIAAGLTKDE